MYPDTFWSFKSILPFVSKKAAFPPLGLLTIAAMLPETWDMRLVDMNVASLGDKDIEWADIVLVSAMIVQVPSASWRPDRQEWRRDRDIRAVHVQLRRQCVRFFKEPGDTGPVKREKQVWCPLALPMGLMS